MINFTVTDLSNLTAPLVDEFFPKGECKERGKAIVLHAKMLIKIVDALNEACSREELTKIIFEEIFGDRLDVMDEGYCHLLAEYSADAIHHHLGLEDTKNV